MCKRPYTLCGTERFATSQQPIEHILHVREDIKVVPHGAAGDREEIGRAVIGLDLLGELLVLLGDQRAPRRDRRAALGNDDVLLPKRHVLLTEEPVANSPPTSPRWRQRRRRRWRRRRRGSARHPSCTHRRRRVAECRLPYRPHLW